MGLWGISQDLFYVWSDWGTLFLGGKSYIYKFYINQRSSSFVTKKTYNTAHTCIMYINSKPKTKLTSYVNHAQHTSGSRSESENGRNVDQKT